jgi:hypothetical protein
MESDGYMEETMQKVVARVDKVAGLKGVRHFSPSPLFAFAINNRSSPIGFGIALRGD